MKHQLQTFSGVDVSWYEAGRDDATPVVMLHGGGLTGATWTRTCNALGDSYRCLAPDLRGHGDAGWESSGHYTLSGHTADLADLLSRHQVHRPHLVGMSLGGQVALHAVLHGLDVTTLTLVDVGPRMVPFGGVHIRGLMNVEGFDTFEAAVDAAARVSPRRSRESLAAGLRRGLRRADDGRWTWKWDRRRLASRDDRAAQAAALWPLVGQLSCPLLVVRGADSELFSDQLARELVEEADGENSPARLVTVAEAGHAVQSAQPVALASALVDFWDLYPYTNPAGRPNPGLHEIRASS